MAYSATLGVIVAATCPSNYQSVVKTVPVTQIGAAPSTFEIVTTLTDGLGNSHSVACPETPVLTFTDKPSWVELQGVPGVLCNTASCKRTLKVYPYTAGTVMTSNFFMI
jgi:hypothetical protein